MVIAWQKSCQMVGNFGRIDGVPGTPSPGPGAGGVRLKLAAEVADGGGKGLSKGAGCSAEAAERGCRREAVAWERAVSGNA